MYFYLEIITRMDSKVFWRFCSNIITLKFIFVIGIYRTKDYTKMLKMFFEVPNAYIYLTEETEKVLLINEYDCESFAKAKYVSANQKEALDFVVTNASDDDLPIVVGSYK